MIILKLLTSTDNPKWVVEIATSLGNPSNVFSNWLNAQFSSDFDLLLVAAVCPYNITLLRKTYSTLVSLLFCK